MCAEGYAIESDGQSCKGKVYSYTGQAHYQFSFSVVDDSELPPSEGICVMLLH